MKIVCRVKRNGIGRAIRHLRKYRGLTQEQLANKTCLSRTSITNIEIGNQKLTEQTLQILADFLGFDLSITFREKEE